MIISITPSLNASKRVFPIAFPIRCIALALDPGSTVNLKLLVSFLCIFHPYTLNLSKVSRLITERTTSRIRSSLPRKFLNIYNNIYQSA